MKFIRSQHCQLSSGTMLGNQRLLLLILYGFGWILDMGCAILVKSYKSTLPVDHPDPISGMIASCH